jgi:ketosteroid isomerase-like protein
MSQENVQVVRRMFALVNRGDIDGLGALVAQDIECFPASDEPDSKPFRGREAFIEYAQGWLAVFDQYVVEPSEYFDLGDCVVVVGRVTARGRGSGAETAGEDAWVYCFRDGQVTEYRECGTKSRALEAVGLRE